MNRIDLSRLNATVAYVALSAALVGLSISPAMAQETPPPPSPTNVSDAGVPDIIVTAQRRSENAQKSSLSISVLSSADLAGINRSEDLQTLVPGVSISTSYNSIHTNIRGIGDKGSSLLSQSSVSYNIDGIYVSDAATVTSEYYDLDRVEILKGPQGTLYGRNASAGSINLVFARPELGKVSGAASAEVGNYNLFRTEGAINLPVGDMSAFRFSGVAVSRSGYLSDGTDDDHHWGVRGQFLFEPSNQFSIRIAADYGKRTGIGPGSEVFFPHLPGQGKFIGANNPVNNAFRAANVPLFYTAGSGVPPLGITGNIRDEFIKQHQANVSAEINADLGFARLTFIPAYRTSDQRLAGYPGSNPASGHENTKEQSYELRLDRSGAWGNVVIGANYLDINQFSDLAIYQAVFLRISQTARPEIKSIAGFGQATINVSTPLRLIVGGRYTSEKRFIDANGVYHQVGGPDYSPFAFSSSTRFNAFTYRVGIEYDVTPSNMVYFTASKGFKSGGFNLFQPTATADNMFKPESLYSYVIGSKNRFLDNRLQLNVEAFYWDYKNAQLTTLALTPVGNLQQLTYNAAAATSYGAEASLTAKPIKNGTLTVAVAYLHTNLKEFLVPSISRPAAGSTACAVLPGSGTGFLLDCSGFPLSQAPEWSGTARYDQKIELGGTNALTLGAAMNFASSRFTDINYTPVEHAPGYALFDADATLDLDGGRYQVTAYIKNIGNKEVPISSYASRPVGYTYSSVLPPRTIGLRLSAKF